MPKRILRNTDDILELFVISGLHVPSHESMIDQDDEAALALCLVPFRDRPHRVIIRRDTPSRNSVQYVADFLAKHRERIDNHVKIFTNFSPSRDCCKDLLKLKGDYGMDIAFVCSALRNRCTSESCKHDNGSRQLKRSPDDLEVIELMQKLGSGVRTFDTVEWTELIELLTMWANKNGGSTLNLTRIRYGEKYGELRDKEDEEMARKVQELLSYDNKRDQDDCQDQDQNPDEDEDNADDRAMFENFNSALQIEIDTTVKSAARQNQFEPND